MPQKTEIWSCSCFRIAFFFFLDCKKKDFTIYHCCGCSIGWIFISYPASTRLVLAVFFLQMLKVMIIWWEKKKSFVRVDDFCLFGWIPQSLWRAFVCSEQRLACPWYPSVHMVPTSKAQNIRRADHRPRYMQMDHGGKAMSGPDRTILSLNQTSNNRNIKFI